MKQFYLTLSVLRCAKSLLLSTFFLGAFYASFGQVYTTRLSGPNEQPPNNSPGTGTGTVTVVGTTMRVQTTFSGLVPLTAAGLPSGTTAAHIHAPTPTPLAGVAGVATTLPTFPGFPSGVRAGTYDQTFNMTLASSYNPAYITANGGTPLTAFAGLKAALDNGRSYLNIHSNAFPGGEIRGFLIACPTINVSIPDAFALAQGVLPNTVYPAYAPAASLTLSTNVSGGTGPYTYNWSNGSTAATTTVRPTVTTQYSVTVHDQNGCPGTASKTVSVVDISSGKKGDKIDVCHKGRNTLSIAVPAVDAHLDHGDMLGSCSEAGESVRTREIVTEQLAEQAFSVKALRNPSLNYFDLQISGTGRNGVQLRVYDLLGRVIESKSSLHSNQTLRIGNSYNPGIYIVEISQGARKQTLKLIKAN